MKTKHIILSSLLILSAPVYAAGGSGNSAFIDQTGPNNAVINQDCLPGGCDHTAGITQVHTNYNGAVGAENNALINQVTASTEAYITQQGNNNSAEIAQRNGSYADIQQIDAFDSTALINQDKDEIDGTLSGFNNTAGIYQTGLVQSALIKQFGDDGVAYVSQSGDANYAKVIQNKGSIGESANITQAGWGNNSDTVMNGQGDTVIVGQSGMKNVMDVDVAETSRSSTITAYQTGTMNNALLYTQGTNNTISGSQNDTDNYVQVVQLGNQQTATYTQDGVANNALIGQYETAVGSTAGVHQFGDNHQGIINQHCANSTAVITQRNGVNGGGAFAQINQQ